MNFSQRTDWNLAENELSAAVRAHRAAGNPLLDLTISNPTSCGFDYDNTALLFPLSNAATLQYEPDPLGMITAREAVTRYYSDAGATFPVDRICLTTSTSEAYSFLFRLLCNAGDEVLVARPSYPLFDYIAQLDDVRLREYPLLYDPNADVASGQGWSIDLHALEATITPNTRAIILVHPNNPTGNFASPSERAVLEGLCLKHSLALIVDEVFLDYPLGTSQPHLRHMPHFRPQRHQQSLRTSADEGLVDRRLRTCAARPKGNATHRDHRRHVPLHERSHTIRPTELVSSATPLPAPGPRQDGLKSSTARCSSAGHFSPASSHAGRMDRRPPRSSHGRREGLRRSRAPSRSPRSARRFLRPRRGQSRHQPPHATRHLDRRSQPVASRLSTQLKNGLCSRSVPMVVVDPCPGTTSVASGKVNSRS
jgi:hypothetical protein